MRANLDLTVTSVLFETQHPVSCGPTDGPLGRCSVEVVRPALNRCFSRDLAAWYALVAIARSVVDDLLDEAWLGTGSLSGPSRIVRQVHAGV